ncbi:putative permease [Evansella vedderi]|uniref:Permease n=1 Tax=Evansella vedderi TaxID=38282 RepID=A0ABU0A2M3_9BACI|nr:AEC family transporter [Evansella vedderi]MDQ0256600.1 putative permease [Evansella vedderi]
MGNFIFALTIIVIGLLFGRGLRVLLDKGTIPSPKKMHQILKGCTMAALLGVNPLIILGAFWYVQLDDIRLTLIPILGGLTLILGGAFALWAAKLYKLNRGQTGSMFASGTFTNLGSFGALFCFVFLGEESLVFVAMFRLFEDLLYYTVAFPIAQSYGEKKEPVKPQSRFKKIITNPFIMITFSCILIGGLLNLSAWERPAVYGDLNSLLVPLFTILLVVPTGFNMRITAVKGFLKESFTISAIKFVVVPVIIVLLAVLFNLHEIHDGMVLKVLILLAAMPPGFTSLVPPQLFKLDMDLANSSWLINTVMLIFVLPILYFIVVYL